MELVPAHYLQEMIAELRFDRALHRIDIRAKNNRIKLLYHHAWSKLPKVTALRFRRAVGMRTGNICKVFPCVYSIFKLKTFFFCVY